MQFPLLINNFSKYISLSQQEIETIENYVQEKSVKKKHFLLQYGEVATKIYFVTSGILRMYAVDKNGFEHNIQFAPTDWWMTDIQSLIKQTPATLFIDALEDATVLSIKISDLNDLMVRIPKLDRFFRMLSENSLASYQQRLANSLSLSAKERYNNFCSLYPDLIFELPQKQIASFIGVTPEFLSKMLSSK